MVLIARSCCARYLMDCRGATGDRLMGLQQGTFVELLNLVGSS